MKIVVQRSLKIVHTFLAQKVYFLLSILLGSFLLSTVFLSQTAYGVLIASFTSDTSGYGFYGTRWVAQTFTTSATTVSITDVVLKIRSYGTPVGNFNLSIYATSGGMPTGSALVTTSTGASSFDTSGNETQLTFSTPLAVSTSTMYAIVYSAPSTNLDNRLADRLGTSSYTEGTRLTSVNSGSSWTIDTDSDTYFKVNGTLNTPPVATTPTFSSQATDGSGYITFQTAISDADNHNTKLKVEYSDDGGTSWYDPDLVSVTPSAGSVSLDDAQTYQIGATDKIDSSGGAVTLTIVWDTKSGSNGNGSLDNLDQSDIQVRVTPHDSIEDGTVQASVNFSVDNLDPTQPGDLTVGGTTESTAVVGFGAQSTDAHFSEYKIFFSQATPVTTADNEFSKSTTPGEPALDFDNYNSTPSTTLSGLVAGTQYYVNIWAYDAYGNSAVATLETSFITNAGTSPPTASIPGSISQATNGTGYITFQTSISDADSEDTKLKVEYSDDGGTTWYDPDLVSATPSAGSVDLDDAQTYQIGTADAVDTSGGAITLTVVWDTKSAGNGHGSLDTTDQTDIKVRVTPNDATVDGNSVASALFEVDNLDPSVPGNLTLNTANTTTVTFNFGSAVVEAHFSEYKIFYKAGAAGVSESDTAFTSGDDADLGTINYGGTLNTTISGLTITTQYVANIWAYDTYGNSSSATELAFYTSADTPGTPTVAAGTATTLTVTIDQATNPGTITYYVCKTDDGISCTDNGYVQSADGSLGASADWQSYATWGGASGVSVTGLATSTAYQFLVKARNTGLTETGFSSANTAVSTLATIPGAPVVSAAGTDRLNVIVDQATNSSAAEYAICRTADGTSCVSGGYVQTDGTLGDSAVWQTHADWDGASGVLVTGLSANTTYQFIVKARNVDTVETAFSSAGSATTDASGGGGGGGGGIPPPPEPTQNPTGSLSINNGDLYTRTPHVLLAFSTQLANEYIVSEDSNFSGTNYTAIVTSTSFSLSTGDGTKTVYARFRNQHGTYTTSSTIVLDTTAPTISLIGSSTVFMDVGSEYVDPGVQAQDILSGNVQVLIDTSRVNTSSVGVYNVVYLATDLAGNSATLLRQVIVGEPSLDSVRMTINRGNRYYNHYRVSIFLYSTQVDMAKYKSARSLEALQTTEYRTIPTSVPEYRRVYEMIHETERTEGEHPIFVRVQTADGHEYTLSGSIILDFTPPREPVISSFVYPRVNGTSDPGDQVRLLWGRNPRTAFKPFIRLAASTLPPGFVPTGQRSTIADENGNWSFVFPILAVGDYIAGFRTQDIVGNVSGYVVQDFTIDVQPESICGNTIVEGTEQCDGSAPQGFVCTATCLLISEQTEPDDPEPDTDPDTEPDSQPDTNPQPDSDPTSNSDTSSDNSDTDTQATDQDPVDTITSDNTEVKENQLFEPILSFIESLSSASGTPAGIVRAMENTFATVKQIVNNPEVEAANEKMVVPTVAAVAVANVATAGFGFAQTIAVIRSFFGQIFLVFRRRKHKKWGTVYNGFTKRPVDLAIVRLIDDQTSQVVQTQVTDAQGRYFLTANPGKYRIEITKDGFVGFSGHLQKLDEDSAYTQLYHGESFVLSEENSNIHFAIPLDPSDSDRPTMQIIRDRTRKKIRFVISSIGFVAAIVSFIISPAWWIILLLVLHGLVYVVFYKLAYHRLPDSFGKVLSLLEHRPLGKVVVRVFDATYNKLVDTTVSDRKGRYAILVGPSTYYVTYEKPTFEKKKSPILDFSSARTRGEGGIIARDETLQSLGENQSTVKIDGSAESYDLEETTETGKKFKGN